jgi:RNA polymerase sigma factor (sigma-70 family)
MGGITLPASQIPRHGPGKEQIQGRKRGANDLGSPKREPSVNQTASVEDLVIRARAGDREAYNTIYERFQEMAFSYAYSILGDHGLAEDAKQEAFLGAYCDLLSLREPAAFPGWFRRIVVRHSITIKRDRRALVAPVEGMEAVASTAPGPSEIAQKNEERERVWEAVRRLPDHEREVTRLFYIENRSIRDVGRITGLPEKTIKSRLFSARERLRHRLMELVKTTVNKKQLAGDKTPARAASAEAITLFDQELRSLLKFPTDQEQRRAGDLLCAKGRLFRFMGKMDQALDCFREGMELPALKQNPAYQARFRTEIGLTRLQTSDYAQARQELETSRAAARKMKPRSPLLACILNGLGFCAWGEGDFSKARRYYQQTVEVCQETDSDVHEAEARNNLALLDWKGGRLEDALRNFRGCLERWKKVRNRFGWAAALMHIGIVEENLGRYSGARRYYEDALKMAREINFAQIIAAALTNLGNLALNEEQWDKAVAHNREALALAKRIKDRRSQAIALENLALAHIGLRNPREAHRFLKEARQLAQAIGDQERLFSLDLVEIEWLLAEESAEPALEKLASARGVLKTKKYLSELPRLLRLKVHAEILADRPEDAGVTLRKARQEARRQKNRPEEKRISLLLAFLCGKTKK